MFNAVQDYTLGILPAKRKRSQSGWITFNAVCCVHNGESADTRGRGGLILGNDGALSWHCFNCGFKTSYVPGRPLSFKYRKFLSWLGASQQEIQRLVVEALRVKDLIRPEDVKAPPEEITFEAQPLPAESLNFWALSEFYKLGDLKNVPRALMDAIDYVYDRKIDMEKYDFYWSPAFEHKMSHRVIIPFMFQNEVYGYTARAINDGIQPKYHTAQPNNFVFNLDNQRPDSKIVIVCEGVFDAMSVDGVGVLHNEINEHQADIIEALGKEVIVVPDFDQHVNKQGKKVWPGRSLIKDAIKYGWNVSFPVWGDDCKDINAAVVKYGKLFTLKAILDGKETNSLKIEIKSKI